MAISGTVTLIAQLSYRSAWAAKRRHLYDAPAAVNVTSDGLLGPRSYPRTGLTGGLDAEHGSKQATERVGQRFGRDSMSVEDLAQVQE